MTECKIYLQIFQRFFQFFNFSDVFKEYKKGAPGSNELKGVRSWNNTIFKNLKMGLQAICTDHTDDLIYNFEVHKGNTDVSSSETVLQASGNITMRILVRNSKHNG